MNLKQSIKKYLYFCDVCNIQYSRWQGKCNNCDAWNTIKEKKFSDHLNCSYKNIQKYNNRIKPLSTINISDATRFSTGFKEFDRVLGGGIVPDSVILIGGNPGTGKSTLLLQTLCMLSEKMKTLYVTGEESLEQVAMRAYRLGLSNENIYMLSENDVEQICLIATVEKPKVIIIDSIQVMYIHNINSSPGSVSQVRETASYLTQFAKLNTVSIFIIGHVTKDGLLAGPKVLEHCVDCSIILDGMIDSHFRTLRSYKNRFGSVNEIGIFSMTEKGIIEVENPCAIFLSSGKRNPGSVVVALWEGSRPLLIEIQVLVDNFVSENARRIVVGLDHNRLSMLLAVLHRHGGLQIYKNDIFINVVGGVKINETSADLAILMAIISSIKNYTLPQDTIIFGEIGLSGEIRPVSNILERVLEAFKHGFKNAIIPFSHLISKNKSINGMNIYQIKHLYEAIDLFNQISNNITNEYV